MIRIALSLGLLLLAAGCANEPTRNPVVHVNPKDWTETQREQIAAAADLWNDATDHCAHVALAWDDAGDTARFFLRKAPPGGITSVDAEPGRWITGITINDREIQIETRGIDDVTRYVAHELGHVMGLVHVSQERASTMSPWGDWRVPTVITPTDLAEFRTVWPECRASEK